MKRNYFNYLFLLSVIFGACEGGGGDDDPAPDLPDIFVPVITFTKPSANDLVLVIDRLELIADITDDRQLDNVRVVLTEPGGDSRVLSDTLPSLFNTSRRYEIRETHLIPKHATLGVYKVTVEAKDKEQNVGRESRTFTMHASDINSTTFAKAFNNALYNPRFSRTVYTCGPLDYWCLYDSLWFNSVLHLMVSTDNNPNISETEWNKFIADFGLLNQSWAKWDGNRDGNLNDEEFRKVISSLSFFKDWDKNRDKYVTPEEMATGIFFHWDLNKDNLLSREEYQEKFYTYMYD